jgi:hypothetical protein
MTGSAVISRVGRELTMGKVAVAILVLLQKQEEKLDLIMPLL